MTGGKDTRRSPYGWDMALAWCPPEDSPLLGGPGEDHADNTDAPASSTAELQPEVTGRRRFFGRGLLRSSR